LIDQYCHKFDWISSKIWLINQLFTVANRTNTEERRAEIVNGLLLAIAEHGYAKATIQIIARKAGIAPGLLHYHFSTKAEILVELVKTLAGKFSERYAMLAASAKSPEDYLFAYVNARLAKGEGENPAVVAAWVMIGSEAVRMPEVRAIYKQALGSEFALLKELLANYLASIGKPLNNLDHLAATIIALMEGAFQISVGAPEVMPPGYAAATAIQLIKRYVGAESQ
jgi:TetR/AcrR family transcriptional repressor of bet genes